MRSRYTVTPASKQMNEKGLFYPDIMQFPIQRFRVSQAAKQYALKQLDIDRLDISVKTEYGVAEFDDLVLWLNKIDTVHNLSPGFVLSYPDRQDLELFVNKYRAG